MASAWDYARFARDLFSGVILDETSLEAMQTWEDTGLEGLSYGLGVIRDERAGSPGIGHSGSTDASGAEVFWFPEEQTAIVLLVNSSLNPPWGEQFSHEFWPAIIDAAL